MYSNILCNIIVILFIIARIERLRTDLDLTHERESPI